MRVPKDISCDAEKILWWSYRMRAGVQLNWIDPNLSWAGVNQRWLSGSHMAVCWWESPIWLNQNARAVCRCFSLHLLRLKGVQSGSRMSSGGAWEGRRLQSFNSLHLSKFVSSALYNRSWLMPWDKMSGHHQQGTWISHLHKHLVHAYEPSNCHRKRVVFSLCACKPG